MRLETSTDKRTFNFNGGFDTSLRSVHCRLRKKNTGLLNHRIFTAILFRYSPKSAAPQQGD